GRHEQEAEERGADPCRVGVAAAPQPAQTVGPRGRRVRRLAELVRGRQRRRLRGLDDGAHAASSCCGGRGIARAGSDARVRKITRSSSTNCTTHSDANTKALAAGNTITRAEGVQAEVADATRATANVDAP